MEVEVSTVVDRPVATVWQFYVAEHVHDHPRWDPDLELEKISDGPIGPGTRIKRRNKRYDPATEGMMEIIEFEPERVLGSRSATAPSRPWDEQRSHQPPQVRRR